MLTLIAFFCIQQATCASLITFQDSPSGLSLSSVVEDSDEDDRNEERHVKTHQQSASLQVTNTFYSSLASAIQHELNPFAIEKPWRENCYQLLVGAYPEIVYGLLRPPQSKVVFAH